MRTLLSSAVVASFVAIMSLARPVGAADVTTTAGGSTNAVPKFTSSSNIENSIISEYNGDALLIGPRSGSGAGSGIELGYNGASGNRASNIDLHGDDTYTDYALRLLRTNSGANADSYLVHRGTGTLRLGVQDAGQLRLFTSNTDRLTIDSSGNVGIGTTSPDYKLEVDGSIGASSISSPTVTSTTNLLRLWVPDDGGITFDYDTGASYAGMLSLSPVSGATMELQTWILSENTGAALTVNNDGNNASRYGIIVQAGEDTPYSNPSATFVQFNEGDGTLTGQITANASGVVSYSDYSDERLKTNIAPTQVEGLVVINDINLIEYNRKKTLQDGSEFVYKKTDIGFSAQNLRQVFPDMVTEDANGFLMVDRSRLVPVLAKAVQEQQEQIQALMDEVEYLRSVVEKR